MKTWHSQTRLVAVLGAVISLPTVFAADADKTDQSVGEAAVVTTPAITVTASTQSTGVATPAVTTTASSRDTATVKLPYGVEDVLKLSRARISEDVTLNYIQNSGTIYNLSAQDLITLKNEGVSDKVLNAMQDQRKRATEASGAAMAAPAVQIYSAPTTAGTTATPVYTPQPIYVQEPAYYDSIVNVEPDYTPASTVYVIPYSTPTYPRYTFASSYPSYGYFGSYGVFGPPPFPRAAVASIGGPIHGGPRGVYYFGGGHGGGGHGLAMSPGHVTTFGGGHGHSGGHHR